MNQQGTRNKLMDMDWVGMDVAKETFDAALVRGCQHYPDTPLRASPNAGSWQPASRTK